MEVNSGEVRILSGVGDWTQFGKGRSPRASKGGLKRVLEDC